MCTFVAVNCPSMPSDVPGEVLLLDSRFECQRAAVKRQCAFRSGGRRITSRASHCHVSDVQSPSGKGNAERRLERRRLCDTRDVAGRGTVRISANERSASDTRVSFLFLMPNIDLPQRRPDNGRKKDITERHIPANASLEGQTANPTMYRQIQCFRKPELSLLSYLLSIQGVESTSPYPSHR